MAKTRQNRGRNTPRIPWQSAYMNTAEWYFYYELLLNLAATRYKWQGLPEEIDDRFLELVLLGKGLAVFFEDPDYGKYFACEAAPSGKINMYRNPTRYQVYGANGYNKLVNARDCVPIWNNYTRSPVVNALEIYARRLYDIDRTLDTNLLMQKYPALIQCSEEQRQTVLNYIKQWTGNEPIIVGDELSLNGIQIGYINPDIPYIGDKLLNAKMVVWSEIMTYLGINNSDVRKAERVQSAEVESNNEQVSMSALVGLDCRRRACEEINREYGLHVWVDGNTDYSSFNFAALATAPGRLNGGDDDGIE